MQWELFCVYERARRWVETLKYLRLIGDVFPQWQMDQAIADRDNAAINCELERAYANGT